MKEDKVDTGIFIETTTKSEGWKESLKAAKELLKWTIYSELKQWEEEALRILRENGFHKLPCEVPRSALPAARDARELLYAIMGARDFIKRNDAANAALCAFRAGHIATRMMVRPAEGPAVTGRKGRAHTAKMRDGRSKKGAKNRQKIINLFSELKAQYEPQECPSDREIINAVSKHTQKKFNTIKSILRRAAAKSAK